MSTEESVVLSAFCYPRFTAKYGAMTDNEVLSVAATSSASLRLRRMTRRRLVRKAAELDAFFFSAPAEENRTKYAEVVSSMIRDGSLERDGLWIIPSDSYENGDLGRVPLSLFLRWVFLTGTRKGLQPANKTNPWDGAATTAYLAHAKARHLFRIFWLAAPPMLFFAWACGLAVDALAQTMQGNNEFHPGTFTVTAIAAATLFCVMPKLFHTTHARSAALVRDADRNSVVAANDPSLVTTVAVTSEGRRAKELLQQSLTLVGVAAGRARQRTNSMVSVISQRSA